MGKMGMYSRANLLFTQSAKNDIVLAENKKTRLPFQASLPRRFSPKT